MGCGKPITSQVIRWPEEVADGSCEHYCTQCGQHFIVRYCVIHKDVPAPDVCMECWELEEAA